MCLGCWACQRTGDARTHLGVESTSVGGGCTHVLPCTVTSRVAQPHFLCRFPCWPAVRCFHQARRIRAIALAPCVRESLARASAKQWLRETTLPVPEHTRGPLEHAARTTAALFLRALQRSRKGTPCHARNTTCLPNASVLTHAAAMAWEDPASGTTLRAMRRACPGLSTESLGCSTMR